MLNIHSSLPNVLDICSNFTNVIEILLKLCKCDKHLLKFWKCVRSWIYLCFNLCVGYLLQLRICDRHLLKLLGCARYLLKLQNALKIYSSFLKVIQFSQICETFAAIWQLSLTFHFATHSLCFFIPIFIKESRMISNKNGCCDSCGFETTLPEFHIIFTTNYHVAFKIFWEQSYFFKAGQLRQTFITK